jgi:hypothetical protein
MGNATLGLNMTVGGDAVQVLRQKNAKASLAQGVPILVNPTKMTNEMESSSMDLPKMKVGGNIVSAAQMQGVPILVNPTKMTNEMESSSMDLPKMKVGGNIVSAA